jgi:hypothetical protein
MRKITVQQIESYDLHIENNLTNDQAYDKLLEAWNDGSLDQPDDVDIHFIIDELEETYLDIERAQNARIELLKQIADKLLKEHETIQEITIVPQDHYRFMIKTKSQIKFIPTKNTEELNREIKNLLESEPK